MFQIACLIFYFFLPAGPKIALRFCVCVCVRPQLSRALSYVIPLLCTIATSTVEATGSLQAQ